MFRASSCPSSGATTTAVAASGLPSELGDSIKGSLHPDGSVNLQLCLKEHTVLATTMTYFAFHLRSNNEQKVCTVPVTKDLNAVTQHIQQ